MEHEDRVREIARLVNEGNIAAAVEISMDTYAIGLKDGKEIAGWKK